MKFHILLIFGLAAIAACGQRDQAEPEQAIEEEPAAEVVEEVTQAIEDAAEAVEPELTAPDDGTPEFAAKIEEWRNFEFLDHMHAHAEHLDDLNYALDDGDLEGASVPAYWLSRHQTVSGLPEELEPYVDRMREAAEAVEAAEDLDTARAGAKRISAECQACHAAVGVAAIP